MTTYSPQPSAHAELGSRLSHRWTAFGRLLRRNGVATTSGQMRDLLRAMPSLDLADRESVYFASRALLCSRKDDLPKFDLVFRQFWGRTRQVIIPSDTGSLAERAAPAATEVAPEVEASRPALPSLERPTLVDSERAVDGSEVIGGEGRLERALLYSAHERLRKLDFARFTEEELAAAKALIASWRWQPGLRRTRRLTPARRGRRLDFPRTLRRAMRTHGVPYTLVMHAPRRKPRPIVLLCDISGSMAPYTRILLHFMHTMMREMAHMEVFVFGTRLTRVTRQLRARNIDHALADVGRQVVDWSGGTRIGEALRTFNTHWARRVMGQGAVVCIISDGWDRGDPTLLASEMAYLQRTSFRLVWLNPLLGMPDYRPLTRGMAAALPFVDDFLPANSIAGLESLASLLSSLDFDVRPDRKQVLLPNVQPSKSESTVPRFSVKVLGGRSSV